MLWIAIVGAIVVIFFLAARGRKQKQREAIAGIRRHFPRLARMRLVAACPGLEGVLDEASLRMLFDWMLIELCRRTGASGLGELMQWSLQKGDVEAARLTAEVTREAVDLLPRPALAIIDECEGRTVASVLLDEALTEAGHRYAPELKKSP